jgi:UMF1 family MFS transporter
MAPTRPSNNYERVEEGTTTATLAVERRHGLGPGVRKREVFGWAMYDFANSGYTTVVLTTIFSAYFVNVVASDFEHATFVWTFVLALSYAAIMVTAPAIGAYADVHASKKKLLFFMTVGCVLSTAAMYFVGPGAVALAALLLIVSNFFYGSGENLAGAFLPELAQDRALGRVSGWGWSIGYFGGLTALVVCLIIIQRGKASGMNEAALVPWTMVATAVVYTLGSIPTFLFLKERAQPRRDVRAASLLGDTFRGLARAARALTRFTDLRRFLWCLTIYQSGVAAVISLAGIYAKEVMGFSFEQLIKLIIFANVSAAIGAFLFGYVQDKIGHLRTIALTLLAYIVVILLMTTADKASVTQFWIAGNLAGFAMGACQSAGRALVGLLAPAPRRAEFFGLWGIAAKFSGILGPLAYGIANALSGGNHRVSLLVVGLFFIGGLSMLLRVRVARGFRAALRETRTLTAARP